jgi:hypothetical protein
MEEDRLFGVVDLLEVQRAVEKPGRHEDGGGLVDNELLQLLTVAAQRQLNNAAQFRHIGEVAADENQELVEIVGVAIGHHQERLGNRPPAHGEIALAVSPIALQSQTRGGNLRVGGLIGHHALPQVFLQSGPFRGWHRHASLTKNVGALYTSGAGLVLF